MIKQKIAKSKPQPRSKSSSPKKKSAKSNKPLKSKSTLVRVLTEQPDEFAVMCIDPGSDNLGWNICRYKNRKKTMLAWGTISISSSKADSAVNGFISVMDKLIEIWNRWDISFITIEDYTIYGGKYTGSTVVPALIYLISYEWFRKTSTEIIRIPLSSWKAATCNNKSADKLEILQSVKPILDVMFPGLNSKIQKHYESLKYEYEKEGIQDCYDSLGQLIYVLAMADIVTNTKDLGDLY